MTIRKKKVEHETHEAPEKHEAEPEKPPEPFARFNDGLAPCRCCGTIGKPGTICPVDGNEI